MLFNSYIFIFIFLPITLIGFYSLGKVRFHEIKIGWLVVASLFFYGWWNPVYFFLILGSICFNYVAGIILGNFQRKTYKKLILIGGVGINLFFLGYYMEVHL